MFQAITSKLFNVGQGLVKCANLCEPVVRTRTTCSKIGKEKSVKTAMSRYFRINNRIWIRAIPGFKKQLYKKPLEERFILQQPVIISKKESRMLERMSGPYFKKLNLENFTQGSFVHYHSFLNQSQYKHNEKKKNKQFYP